MHESKDRTSQSLLLRLRDNDTDGWKRLTRLYGGLVYSWCRGCGLQSEDAADVMQDVFQAVSQKISTFRRDRPGDSFRKWLKTIAFNKIRDHFRRRQAEPNARGGSTALEQLAQLPDLECGSSPQQEEAEIGYLFRQATELVRAEVEPTTWHAFWQTAVEDRAASDVAADLGITVNAVRIAKSRVRARLKVELDGLVELPESNG